MKLVRMCRFFRYNFCKYGIQLNLESFIIILLDKIVTLLQNKYEIYDNLGFGHKKWPILYETRKDVQVFGQSML